MVAKLQAAAFLPSAASKARFGMFLGLAFSCLLASACDDPMAPPMGHPVEGAWISDAFGPRPVHPVLGKRGAKHHDGVDFAIAHGAPFKATMAGEVFEAGNKAGYGLAVFIRHQDGYETRYAHASQLLVKSGQKVAAGQVIGLVGRSGTATGPHLHYELRQHGKALDPMPFLARAQDGPSPLPSPSPQPSRFMWPSPRPQGLQVQAKPSPMARRATQAKPKAAGPKTRGGKAPEIRRRSPSPSAQMRASRPASRPSLRPTSNHTRPPANAPKALARQANRTVQDRRATAASTPLRHSPAPRLRASTLNGRP